LHLRYPFYGARRLAKQLVRDGFEGYPSAPTDPPGEPNGRTLASSLATPPGQALNDSPFLKLPQGVFTGRVRDLT
jgi:hypothetical protein